MTQCQLNTAASQRVFDGICELGIKVFVQNTIHAINQGNFFTVHLESLDQLDANVTCTYNRDAFGIFGFFDNGIGVVIVFAEQDVIHLNTFKLRNNRP
ncbi:hypothetical protein D3C75_1098410 [compost metagenome]